MREKQRWYENGNVHPDALAAFRSYERYSDDELVTMIDRRLPDTSAASVFPTAKGCSRRVLEGNTLFSRNYGIARVTRKK